MIEIDKSKLKEVTSYKIFQDSKFSEIDQNGILSEVIFGPTLSYKCNCKKFNSKSLFRNMRCPTCNVECVSSDERYKRFAKISLIYPVYNIFKLKKIKHSLGKNNHYIIDPKQNDLAITLKKFLCYNSKNDKIFFENKYIPGNSIPINITGIFSFYLALQSAYRLFNSTYIKSLIDIFIDDLLVIPPECRVSAKITNLDGKEQLLRNKLDDLYSQIIYLTNFNNIQDKIDINKYTHQICNMFQNCATTYIDNEDLKIADTITCRLQYYVNDIYSTISSLLSGKSGYIRKYFLGRTIDFSARSVVVVNPKLKAFQINISKKIFMSLYFMEYLQFLKFIKKRSYSRLLYYVRVTDNFYKDLEYTDEFISYFFKTSDLKKRLILINRQPTLWRYGIPAVEVCGVNNNNVIYVSSLIVDAMEMDFDGDTCAVYRVHSTEALNELYDKAFILNNLKFDHNNNFINILHSESIYVLNFLLDLEIDLNLSTISFDDAVYDYGLKYKLAQPVDINNTKYPFGLVLLNKWLGFKSIQIKSKTKISDIYEIILQNSINNEEYFSKLTNLEKKLNWFLSTHSDEILTLPFNDAVSVLKNNSINLISKLPKSPYIGNIIYNSVVDSKYEQIPKSSQLYKLSKVKFKKQQFAKSVVSVGYLSDNNNYVNSEAITGSLLAGLTKEQFFQTTYGARKGLTDKAKAVPQSGYLERSMVLNLSVVELAAEDCRTKYGFNIKIQDFKHAASLKNRYFYNHKKQWELFTEKHYKLSINQELYFRSPITCATSNFKICKKCFGKYQNIKSKYVGILAGQYIAERLTQLSMSSFHTSGSATLPTISVIQKFIQHNLIDIINNNNDNETILIFKNNIPQELYEKFMSIKMCKNITYNKVYFENKEGVENKDVTAVMKDLNNLLKTEKQDIKPVQESYNEFIKNILQLNIIYSVFIEIIFCNLYVNKNSEILRYALNDNGDTNITKKFGIKQVHTNLSPILSLLYQPNAKSILKIKNLDSKTNENFSIFEKIWLDQL